MSFKKATTFATGLSDFHKMVLTVFKMKFPKSKPKVVTYRSYKKFDENQFKSDIKRFMNLKFSFSEFNKTFTELLDKHAPLKKRILRANEVPYMTKALRKAIMRRSQLETKYHKHKTDEFKLLYKKQKNYVSRLYKFGY